MAKLERTIGSTSQLVEIFIQDTRFSDGRGLAGLVFNTASLSAYYTRTGDSSTTAITLATMTSGTWASGGFVEIDATHMKGWYQIGLPNACFTGAIGQLNVHIDGASNMAPVPIQIQIVGYSKGNSATVAQAGGASTITLASTADATDSYYNGQQVQILSGTGVRQVRTVIGYVGSTKVATVDRAWATAPDNTSYYAILPHSMAKLSTSLGTTVSGYETNQDPGTYVLATPANKLATNGSGYVTLNYPLKKNTAYSNFEFFAWQSSDPTLPATGITFTGTVSLDGAAAVSLTNSVTEIANGRYKINLAAADLNGNFALLVFTGVGAIPVPIGIPLQS